MLKKHRVYQSIQEGFIINIDKLLINGESPLFLEDSYINNNREVISVLPESNKLAILYPGENERIKTFRLTFSKEKIKNCYTMPNGNRILQTREPCKMYLVDQNFNLLKSLSAGDKLWHGSYSIDTNKEGVVMYSEYTATKDINISPLHVWKSEDWGQSWKPTLTLNSSPRYGIGECRPLMIFT